MARMYAQTYGKPWPLSLNEEALVPAGLVEEIAEAPLEEEPDPLMERSLAILREEARFDLGIIGASKIRGGKKALVARMREVLNGRVATEESSCPTSLRN